MVEHAAVNRVVVGSSPTSGANFPKENENSQSSDTVLTQETPEIASRDMKWPQTVRARKNGPVLAKIYQPCEGRNSFRVAWRASGRRMMRSFAKFSGRGGAKEFAEGLVKELAQDSQVASLTAAEARSALALRDALEGFRRETGRSISAVQAVTEYLAAVRKLGDRPLSEAVAGYLGTVATVQTTSLSVAVDQFLGMRAPKAQATGGKRPQLSPLYALHIERWLREFATAFPGHQLTDIAPQMLGLYLNAYSQLSPKSRNDRRAALAMFFRWCVRQNYLPPTQRLIEADAMQKEPLDTAPPDFYRPNELRHLLDTAEGQMRAVIALQALAGLRLEETLRLKWENVFGIEGHIEIRAQDSKTRRRRLIEICPALSAWLESYRGSEGNVWTATATLNGLVSAFARVRESLNIPSRRNGLRHAWCSYHFALYSNENLTAAQAGNSPAMIHAHYKGLGTKSEAEKWFNVKPSKYSTMINFPKAIA